MAKRPENMFYLRATDAHDGTVTIEIRKCPIGKMVKPEFDSLVDFTTVPCDDAAATMPEWRNYVDLLNADERVA